MKRVRLFLGPRQLQFLVVGVIGICLALIVAVAIQRTRESAREQHCRDNMRAIGVALLAYQKDHGQLPPFYSLTPPNDEYNLPTQRSLFWLLRSHFGQTKESPIAQYLCPGRRGKEVGTKVDYGFFNSFLCQEPESKSIFLRGRRPVIFAAWMKDPGGMNSTDDIVDGASNTILMAHKGLDPEFYHRPPIDPPCFTGARMESIAAARDFGWQPFRLGSPSETRPTGDVPMWGNLWDIGRYPFALLRDRTGGYFVDEFLFWEYYDKPESVPSYSFMTSPHVAAMPVLWADGSVRPLAYTVDYRLSISLTPRNEWRVSPSDEVRVLAQLWMMNDSAD